LLSICFDNAWKTRSRLFSLLFPMKMNVIRFPLCYSSNTIRVYKRYCKEHGSDISYNVVKHFYFVAFHTIEKRAYFLWFEWNVALKDTKFPCPNFCIIPTAMKFKFPMWTMCHIGFINWSPKGHVEHNKKLN
jgi:hypothetical protein